MRILYVINTLTMGGAENIVIHLAEKMFERGHQVNIVYLFKYLPQLKPKYSEISIYSLDIQNYMNLSLGMIKFFKIFNGFKPDIVHSHLYHSNIFCRLAKSFMNFKLICSVHGNNEGTANGLKLYRYTDKFSNLNTHVSESGLEKFIGKKALKHNNSIVVHNGVDTNRFKPHNILSNQDDTVKFIAIGRLAPEKDFENLLNAFSEVTKVTTKSVHLNIVGDGSEKDKLVSLTKKLKLEETVSFLGNRKDIPELLNQSDSLVLSSKFEGLPTVIMEAMACGIFVIATDCGGCREIMAQSGLIVDKENCHALASGITQFLSISNKEIQENKAISISRIEEEFSLEKSADRWIEIYESIN